MSVRVSVEQASGNRAVLDRLDLLISKAKNPKAAAQASAEWMSGEVFRIFSNAFTVDGPWTPISKVTGFLRRHRANAPRASDTPGSDSGRLKGSFFPDWAQDGRSFGTGTNVEYAARFNEGGPSEANTVAIAGFKRSNTKRKIKDFVMHMKAGHDVPARQFFPRDIYELESWGWLDKVRQIFAIDFAGGKA